MDETSSFFTRERLAEATIFVVGAAVWSLVEDASRWIRLTTVLLGVIAIVAIQSGPTIRRYSATLYWVLSSLSVGSFALFAILTIVISQQPSTNLTTSIPLATPSAKKYFPAPLSLRNLFDTDNFNSFSIANDATITNPLNGHHNVVTFKLFEDFNEKVEFFSVFIPRSPDAFDLCLAVAHNYRAVLNQLHQRIQVWTTIPGETARTGTHDLTFSGRIYIYLDDDLSLQQLATLETFYNQNGLSPEFRSNAFLTLHWNEHREIPQFSRPPSRSKING